MKPIKINKEITGLKYSIYFCIIPLKKLRALYRALSHKFINKN